MNEAKEAKDTLSKETRKWIDKATELYSPDKPFREPELDFTLKGSTAGQFNSAKWTIRYNIPIYERHPDDFIKRTVPHEVAHLVVSVLKSRGYYGRKKVRPHGPEWKAVMRKFGVEDTRCHSYDVEGLVRRRGPRSKPVKIRCGCGERGVTVTIGRRMMDGGQYRCRKCKHILALA